MTTENQVSDMTEPQPTFGTRIKSAREALGLEYKNVAAHLRLNEKTIQMLETGEYPPDLPVTFIQGYMRAYAKFVNIPEVEIKTAIEALRPKVAPHDAVSMTKPPAPVTSGHYFMQFFTYLIVVTLVGLVGTWWYSHSSTPIPMMAKNQLPILPESPPLAVNTQEQPRSDSKSLGVEAINQALKVAMTTAPHTPVTTLAKPKIVPAEQDEEDDDDGDST